MTSDGCFTETESRLLMNNIGNPDLIQQQFAMSERGDALIRELAKQGDLLAQANYSYYVQKTKTAYRLKAEGWAATMIAVLLKGEPEVALLMRERDIAQSRYQATIESINMLKLQMRMNDNQIQREWGRNE